MKKFSITILAVLLFGCVGLFGKPFSGALSPLTSGGIRPQYEGVIMPFFVEHSPFNFIFSIAPLDHPVCHKPLLFFPGNDPLKSNYQYKGLLFRTNLIGSNYIRVSGNIVLQNKNTFLLLPNDFTLPVNSPMEQLPTMTLPKGD